MPHAFKPKPESHFRHATLGEGGGAVDRSEAPTGMARQGLCACGNTTDLHPESEVLPLRPGAWEHRRMGLRDKNLIDDERVVLTLRSHAKALVWPFVLLIVLIGLAVMTFLVSTNDVVTWVVLGVLVVAALAGVFFPWLRWRTTSVTITTQRIAERHGILTRTGRDIPLFRINSVSIEKGVVDRMLGCGTLLVADATEKLPMKLHDVPKVESVHRTIQQLLWSQDDGGDDGTFPPNEPPRGRR